MTRAPSCGSEEAVTVARNAWNATAMLLPQGTLGNLSSSAFCSVVRPSVQQHPAFPRPWHPLRAAHSKVPDWSAPLQMTGFYRAPFSLTTKLLRNPTFNFIFYLILAEQFTLNLIY